MDSERPYNIHSRWASQGKVLPNQRQAWNANTQGDVSGRPSASHYFVGVQDSHLFFLDPHCTRPTLPSRRPDEAYTPEELDTYHTRRLRRINIKDMDPSMLIGFLIKDEIDWTDWKERVQSTPGKPIIHIFANGVQADEGYGRKEALDEVEVLDDSDALA